MAFSNGAADKPSFSLFPSAVTYSVKHVVAGEALAGLHSSPVGQNILQRVVLTPQQWGGKEKRKRSFCKISNVAKHKVKDEEVSVLVIFSCGLDFEGRRRYSSLFFKI